MIFSCSITRARATDLDGKVRLEDLKRQLLADHVLGVTPTAVEGALQMLACGGHTSFITHYRNLTLLVREPQPLGSTRTLKPNRSRLCGSGLPGSSWAPASDNSRN